MSPRSAYILRTRPPRFRTTVAGHRHPGQQSHLSAAVLQDLEDEALMSRYSDGDDAAFGVLFERYGERVYRFLLHSTGSPALTEDLSQQTWLQVHRARRSFRMEERFAAWLYTIAANLRRDAARRKRRRPEDLTSDGQLPTQMVEAPPPPGEGIERVRRALASLPEGYRDVIIMHRWHDLNFAEIAAILGTTESAIKLRAFRGYERLRELLREGDQP